MMTLTNEQVVANLHPLLQLCRRAEEGFSAAALAARDDHLRTLLINYAQERTQLAAELQQEIRDLGGQPDYSHSSPGGHVWDLPALAAAEDDSKLLQRCQQSVGVELHDYQAALGRALPFRVRQVLSRQQATMLSALQRMRELAGETTAVNAP